jgi:glycosyltransferase involved in cell wall biosynthesis
MNNYLVTILMPVYNGEAYLKTAINSVLKQTYPHFELLIINDGSTDGTVDVLKSYSDSRIRVIHQENKGVSRSLNKGINLARGTYIRRHDADDFSEPDMLQVQMDFLEKHPDIDFVGTRCAFMTDRSKVAYKYTQPKIQLFSEEEDYLLVTREMFNPYSPIVHGTVLGPTAVFKEMGGYRTEFLTSEDNDLWLRIIEKYKFAVLKHTYYYLRLSSTSATQMHKSSVGFYRDLCLQYAEERAQKGSDPIMRGEAIPKPEKDETLKVRNPKAGKNFRSDILGYSYKVDLNAKDYVNIFKDIKFALKDGWKLKATYKALLFPLLGDQFVQSGVRIKKLLK